MAQGDAVLTPRVTKGAYCAWVPRARLGQREGLRERFGQDAQEPDGPDLLRRACRTRRSPSGSQPASVPQRQPHPGCFHLRDRVQIAVAWYKSGG